MFTTLKDKSIAVLLRTGLNQLLQTRLKGTGSMLDCRIDSTAKQITLTVELAGETEPVTITVHNYSFTEENGRQFIQFETLETSREWMTTLAYTFASSRKIAIPEKYARVIKLAL